MASSVKCPRCGAAIPLGDAPKMAGTVTCPACAASFKVRSGSKSEPPPPPVRESEPDDWDLNASTADEDEFDAETEDLQPLPSRHRPARRKPESEKGQKPGNAKPDKPRAAKHPDEDGRWKRLPLTLAAVAGALACMLTGSLFFAGNKAPAVGDKAPAGSAEQKPAAPAAKFDQAKFAVIEAPVPENELPPADPPPANVATAPTELPGGDSQAAAAPEANSTAADDASKPLWDVPIDAPSGPPEPVADDLEISVAWSEYERTASGRLPVLASLDGPYVLGMSTRVDETAAKSDPPKTSKKAAKKSSKASRSKKSAKADAPATPEATAAQKPIDRWRTPLFDLRTGKEAGAFAAMPGRWERRLSPRGEFLITRGRLGEKDVTDTDGLLYSWELDDLEPLAEIKLPGYVVWLDFISDDHIAMLAIEPEQLVQIVDVATANVIRTIPLEQNAFRPAELRSPRNRDQPAPPFGYAAGSTTAAVSAGGRYLAISGRDGVTLVSLAEGKELGVMPISQDTPERYPIQPVMDFSPDGKHLYLATTHRHSVNSTAMQPYFMVWDVATGRLVSESNVGSAAGKLLPGPEEGTFFGSSSVIDTFAGQVIYAVPFLPIRPSGPDRYLALTANESNQPLLAVKAIDRDDYLAKAAEARGPIGPRPQVAAADRAGITTTVPEPPAAWVPPPGSDEPRDVPAEKAVLGQWPAALGDRLGVLVSYRFTMKAVPGIGERGRLEMFGQRVDLRTGKTLGEKKLLWPWIAKPDRHHATQPEHVAPPLAALMADGRRFALRDPADHSRVDVWNEDFARAGGLKPYGDAAIDWLGWSADGKLLTIGSGLLSAWDAASGKALYEVQGNYVGTADFGPERKWLAAAAPDGVDLVDGNTGQCLGRCRREGAGEPFVAVAVAPDGKSLAAVYPGFHPPIRGGKKPTDYVAHLWDLETGRASSVFFGERSLQALHWSTPRHLLAASGLNVALIDARHGEVAWSGVLDGLLYGAYRDQKRDYFKTSPDGRVWALRQRRTAEADWTENDVWAPQRIPDFESPGIQSALGDDVAYLTVLDGVRVEVDAGDREKSQAAARKIAGTLQRRGFTIAPGQWILRVSPRITDGQEKLEMQSGSSIPIPHVGFVWQLIGPDGGVGWEAHTGVGWSTQSSKYFLGAKLDYSEFPEPGTTGPARLEKFNFGNQDVRTAIIQEQFERPRKALEVPDQLPARLLQSGTSHKELPVTEMVMIE